MDTRTYSYAITNAFQGGWANMIVPRVLRYSSGGTSMLVTPNIAWESTATQLPNQESDNIAQS